MRQQTRRNSCRLNQPSGLRRHKPFRQSAATAGDLLGSSDAAPGPRALWRAFSSQSIGFKAACVYIFFEYFRPQSLWPVLDGLPLTMLIILAGFVTTVPEASRAGWTRSPANLWLAAYAVLAMVSLLFADFPSYGLSQWDYLAPWLVIYVFLCNAVTSRDRFLLLLLVYFVCNLKLSQFGLRTWALGGFSFSSWGISGPKGWFQNQGELGVQMAMFTPLSALVAVGMWRRFGLLGKVLLVLAPLSAFVTTIGSNSRGAIIAVAVAAAWALLACGVRLRTLVGLAGMGLVGTLLIGEGMWDRFSAMGDDATSLRRLTYISDGLEIIKDHPVLGIGYFNWLPYYEANFAPIQDVGASYLGDYQLPHNILIQVTSELGIPGLLVFLMLVALTLLINYRTRSLLGTNDRMLRLVAHGLDASLVAFLISGQFVTILYYPYFWINLTMTVALHEACRRDLLGSAHGGSVAGVGARPAPRAGFLAGRRSS